MLVMRTAEDPANPVGKFVSTQETVGLDHLALAVDPFGLYGVQPWTLLGQKTAHDPYAFATLFDPAVVLTEPAPDLLGDMPARVVPDQEQGLLAKSFEFFGTPRKESGRYAAHGPTIHEPQPRLIELWQIEPVTGDGLRLGIVLGDRLLDEAHRLPLLGPAIQGGQGQPAPPALVLETHRPLGVGRSNAHQSVATPFFFRIGDLGK